jgi:hypothetical protein
MFPTEWTVVGTDDDDENSETETETSMKIGSIQAIQGIFASIGARASAASGFNVPADEGHCK